MSKRTNQNAWSTRPAEFSPAFLYDYVERQPGSVLLDNAVAAGPEQGLSRLFLSPLRTLVAWKPEQLGTLLQQLNEVAADGLTAAGYLTYECGQAFEPKAAQIAPANGEPLAWFGVYSRSYLVDSVRGRFFDAVPPELEAFCAGQHPAEKARFSIEQNLPLLAEEYARKIEAIQDWIRSGDIYQLNLTVPLAVRLEGSFAALYQHLRRRQPVRYGAFLHGLPERRILSLSPELFFRLEESGGQRRMVTKPMKGTAPRGRTTAEDRVQAEWLRNDEKNRAENLMIVDLLRNDLGRIARIGSVQVDRLFAVERHPTLLQMTSTVSAELAPSTGYAEIFRALFPSGSITGAPKLRALQLIAELEARPRGVYTGSIGYIAPDHAEFSVAIRTLEFAGRGGAMGLGGGITIDSTPASEFAECKLKGRFLVETPPEFQLIETLLWRGDYPFLPLHLDRLADSAAYFAFPCEPSRVEAELLAHARAFADSAPRKIRLLLDRQGRLAISSELLLPSSATSQPVRLFLSDERTDPADPFYFHKTTHRPLYTRLLERARRQGCEDVLFFNLRGELTEGAISNVFLEKNGHWATPPLACGLLPGVQRRHLFTTHPEIEERILTEQDLRNADSIWIANAVRGLRRAEMA